MNSSNGHESWQPTPATTDNSIRFDRSINTRVSPNSRAWLCIDDISEDVALWLNDRYLGELGTSFQPHFVELRESTEQAVLSIEFLNRHHIEMPEVTVFQTGPMRITRRKITCTEASSERGALEIHIEIDSNISTSAWIRTVITHSSGHTVLENEQHHTLARGKNRLRSTELLDRPEIWQPQPSPEIQPALYEVQVSTGIIGDSNPSNTVKITTAFRSVSRHKRTLAINDTPFPLAFVDASSSPLPTHGPESLVRLTKVNKDAVYHQADAEGVLICQTLPRDFNEARHVIDTLTHHPSIVAWSRSPGTQRWWPPHRDILRRTVDRTDPTRPFLE